MTETAADWINENTYQVYFDVDSAVEVLMDIDVVVTGAMDEAGNEQNDAGFDDFFDIVIETVTSVEDNNLELSDLALYPNPVQSGMEFIVEIGGQVDKLSWQLIDQNGRIVMAEEGIAIHNGQMNISTSNLPAGMYFVRLYTANEQNVLKVEVSK